MEAKAVVNMLGKLSSERDCERFRGLFQTVLYVGADYNTKFAEENSASLLYALKGMVKGFPEEIVLATQSPLSMTVGPGDQSDELYEEALPLVHQSRDGPILILDGVNQEVLMIGKYGWKYSSFNILVQVEFVLNILDSGFEKDMLVSKYLQRLQHVFNFTPEDQEDDGAYYVEREEAVVCVCVPMPVLLQFLALCAFVSEDIFVKEAAMEKIWGLICSINGDHISSAAIVPWSQTTNPYLPYWTARLTYTLWSLMENTNQSVRTAETSSLLRKRKGEGCSSGGGGKQQRKKGKGGEDDGQGGNGNDGDGGAGGGGGGGGGEDPPPPPDIPEAYEIVKPIINENVNFTWDEARDLFAYWPPAELFQITHGHHAYEMSWEPRFQFNRAGQKILHRQMFGEWENFITDNDIRDEELVEVTFARVGHALSLVISRRVPHGGAAGGGAAGGGAAGGGAAGGGAAHP